MSPNTRLFYSLGTTFLVCFAFLAGLNAQDFSAKVKNHIVTRQAKKFSDLADRLNSETAAYLEKLHGGRMN